MENLKVKQVKDFNKLPANAILIVFHDHYEYNSGDCIYFTDNKGKINGEIPSYWAWHESPDDRGIISMAAITAKGGAFVAFMNFRKKCDKYVEASKILKDWQTGKRVYNIEGLENSKILSSELKYSYFTGVKLDGKENEERNNEVEILLMKQKENAAKWFVKNEISVRNAYDFITNRFFGI